MRKKRTAWVGFVVFCLVAGSIWLFDLGTEEPLNGLLRSAVHEGLIALGAGLVAVRLRRRAGLALDGWWKIALAGVALLAVPELVFAGASAEVSYPTFLLITTIVPCVVVVAAGYGDTSFGASESPLQSLLPALAGLGGAALLLSFAWPPTLSGRLWICGLVLAEAGAALAAVWLHSRLQDVPISAAIALVFGAAALVTGCGWAWLQGRQTVAATTAAGAGAEVLRLLLFDAPAAVLLVWLLRALPPVALSARALLIPFVMLVESLVLAGAGFSWTTALGLVLMLGGALGLMRTRYPQDAL